MTVDYARALRRIEKESFQPVEDVPRSPERAHVWN